MSRSTLRRTFNPLVQGSRPWGGTVYAQLRGHRRLERWSPDTVVAANLPRMEASDGDDARTNAGHVGADRCGRRRPRHGQVPAGDPNGSPRLEAGGPPRPRPLGEPGGPRAGAHPRPPPPPTARPKARRPP